MVAQPAAPPPFEFGQFYWTTRIGSGSSAAGARASCSPQLTGSSSSPSRAPIPSPSRGAADPHHHRPGDLTDSLSVARIRRSAAFSTRGWTDPPFRGRPGSADLALVSWPRAEDRLTDDELGQSTRTRGNARPAAPGATVGSGFSRFKSFGQLERAGDHRRHGGVAALKVRGCRPGQSGGPASCRTTMACHCPAGRGRSPR